MTSMAMRMAPSADRLSFFTSRPPMKMPRHAHGMAVMPGETHAAQTGFVHGALRGRTSGGGGGGPKSWLAEVVVRLNCCSRYFPRKAAKPATTAISMHAARMMQVNTGFDRRCLVTLGMTGEE